MSFVLGEGFAFGLDTTIASFKSSLGPVHGRRSWGDEGDASPLRPKRGGDSLYNHPPYKGDEQMKSVLHNTQIITPEEIVSYIEV